MKYRVILADPPWKFGVRSPLGMGRSAEAHYACMELSEIKALAPMVQELADDPCALCLWVTDPLLPQGLEVMKEWGFTYKTVLFTWAKLNPAAAGMAIHAEDDEIRSIVGGKKKRAFHMGTGYYTRANPEMCLLGTRGKRTPKVLDHSVPQLLVAPRGQHSAKPDEAKARIERLFEGPYVELFSRKNRPGWSTAISKEAGLRDTGTVETRRWASSLKEKAA